MAVFRVERNSGYTVMSNHHLRNKELTLKAKGLLSAHSSKRIVRSPASRSSGKRNRKPNGASGRLWKWSDL